MAPNVLDIYGCLEMALLWLKLFFLEQLISVIENLLVLLAVKAMHWEDLTVTYVRFLQAAEKICKNNREEMARDHC